MARDQNAQAILRSSLHSAQQGLLEFFVPVAGTLDEAQVHVKTAPSGGSAVFDVLVSTDNGNTFASLGVSLAIGSGAHSATASLAAHAVAMGDFVRVDLLSAPGPFGDIVGIGINVKETGASDADAFLLADANQTFTDVATNNADATKHGFCPKGDGNASHFLNGQLAFVSAGGGGGGTLAGIRLRNSANVLLTGDFPFDTETYKNGITHDSVTEKVHVTVVTTGYYLVLVHGFVDCSAAGAPGSFSAGILLNDGSEFIATDSVNYAIGDFAAFRIASVVHLTAGDTVKLNMAVSDTLTGFAIDESSVVLAMQLITS